MAIISCEECSKEISNKATACPYCGCPIETSQEDNQTKEPYRIPDKYTSLVLALISAILGFILGQLLFKEPLKGLCAGLLIGALVGGVKINHKK